MQPDDDRLSEFDDELERTPTQRDDNELYAAGSGPSHRLTDVFYEVETKPRHPVETDEGSSSALTVADTSTGSSETKISRRSSTEAIRAHIEKYIGTPQLLPQVENSFLSEREYSPVEVFYVGPTPARPFHTLITAGMSHQAMSAPTDEIRYAELVVTLPASWPVSSLSHDSFDEEHTWPLQWLQILANLPHEHDTWLGRGHTIPNGDPAEPFTPDTDLCCMILLPPFSIAREFRHLQVEENGATKLINFYAMVPIYKEEMELKLRQGSDALVKLFRKHSITDVLDTERRNVCKKHRWWF